MRARDDARTETQSHVRAYAWVAGVVFLVASAVPVFVQWNRAAFFEPPFSESIWKLPAKFGPVMPQMWALPFVLAGAVLGSLVAFDFLVRVTRADPDDLAWKSFAWAVRGWRGWLPWMMVPLGGIGLAGVLGLSHAGNLFFSIWFLWLVLGAYFPLLQLIQALDSRNLRGEAPPRKWSARLPTATAALLAVPMMVAALPWPGSPRFEELARTIVFMIALPTWWLAKIAWLARVSPKELPNLLRRILRWRIVAPIIVQWSRLALICASLTCAFLPIVVFVTLFLPQAEETLAVHGLAQVAPVWGPIVLVSRFAVAWWWAVTGVLVVIGDGSLAMIENIAWARLLVRAGVIDGKPT